MKKTIPYKCRWAIVRISTEENNGKIEEFEEIIATFSYCHRAQAFF